MNATASGNDLVKSSAVTAWDAGAVSTRAIVSMDGYVELVPSETTGNRMIGLSNGDTNQGYPDIDFAIDLAGGNLVVSESFTVANSTSATLTSLSISGASSVRERSTASYTATATFSDGTTQSVTASTSWSENSPYAIGRAKCRE